MCKMMKGIGPIALVIALGTVLACSSVQSADFPKKAIRIVVTAGPGGGEDVEARGLAPFVEKYLGVGITIENQAGAGGKSHS